LDFKLIDLDTRILNRNLGKHLGKGTFGEVKLG
jgi:5'-AMP-activated protein kinase catalytic alpha subunit